MRGFGGVNALFTSRSFAERGPKTGWFTSRRCCWLPLGWVVPWLQDLCQRCLGSRCSPRCGLLGMASSDGSAQRRCWSSRGRNHWWCGFLVAAALGSTTAVAYVAAVGPRCLRRRDGAQGRAGSASFPGHRHLRRAEFSVSVRHCGSHSSTWSAVLNWVLYWMAGMAVAGIASAFVRGPLVGLATGLGAFSDQPRCFLCSQTFLDGLWLPSL